MQIKRGKVLFGFKDTYSMKSSLSEVIYAGLVKYKEVINGGEDRKGIPSSITNELEELNILPENHEVFDPTKDYWEICYKRFDYILDEMIYAFADNEPDIMDYDFSFDFTDRVVNANGTISTNLVCTNEDENVRHTSDCRLHEERCERGRLLFAKHFNGLWW